MRSFHRVHSNYFLAIIMILFLTLIAENSHAQPVFSFSDRAESVTFPANTVAAQSPLKFRTGTPPIPRSILLIHDARIKTTAKADSITSPGTPHKIGYGREVPQLSDTEDTSANLQWLDSQNGGLIAAISIASQQAKGIRIGLLVKRLPAEATVRFYSQGAENAYEVSGKEIVESIKRNLDAGESGDYANTYWSPHIDGEEATIEIELPADIGKEAVEIAIPKVSHIYISPIATQEDSIKSLGDAESCEIDVNCYSAWSSESNATAKMSYVAVDGNSYVCTGTLLSDTASSYTPYFLSANHCISKQTEASTLHTYWFYRSTSCNSSLLNSGYKTIYGGATLLYASSSTDTSFMKLNDAPPTGAMYAGWDASTPVLGTSVVDIHHPSGDLQKISFGNVSSFMDCTTLDPMTDTFTCSNATSSSGEFITVTLSNGITEGGSSGSGIFKTVGSGHYLIGQLYGGTSSCYSTSGTDRFGRFDLAYNAALYQWLKPGTTYSLSVSKSGNGNGTVTSSPTGINCGTTCSALFESGSSVTLTAVSSSGSTFSGWGGACSGASSSCTVVMDAANSVTATFAAPVISLGEALDNTALVWTTGGNVPFTAQTASSYYGGSAVQTGKIGNSQSTYLSTTVTGPGTLSFYWKVSSERNYDIFRVYFDGVSTYKLSGNTSWSNNTLSIPAGTHTVKWEYAKDYLLSSGLDAGWVDLVVFAPTVTIGTCGSSNGGIFLAAPTYNLCTTGTASTVTGNGPWYWSCTGNNGGTTANCNANIQTWTITPTLPGGNGTVSCTTPVNNGATSTCKITPATGYQLATFMDNSVDKQSFVAGGSYSIGNITANHSIVATFTLSSPTIQTTKAKVFLGADDNFTVSNNGTILYGNIGNNEVTIASGVTDVVLDQNIERIILADVASNYTFRQTGNIITVYDATGTTLIMKVPVQGDSNGTQLSFSNGTVSAEVKLTSGIMTLGEGTVSTSSAMTLNPLTTASSPSTATSTTAKVYLGTDDIFTVSNSGTTVYGSAGNDIVTIAAGMTGVTLDQNVERINFTGELSSYAFRQTGNLINVYDVSNISLLLAKAPVQGDTNGTLLSFSDVTASSLLAAGVMTLGGAIVPAATPLTLVGLAPADIGL